MKRMTNLSITLMIPTLIASFLWHECGHPPGEFSARVYFHHTFVGNIISSDIRMVQKD